MAKRGYKLRILLVFIFYLFIYFFCVCVLARNGELESAENLSIFIAIFRVFVVATV